MSIKAKNWRIIDLINWGVTHFTTKGINNARLEIEWLLCDLLTCNRVDLYLKFEKQIHANELAHLRSMVKRRVSGEPFQYIIGKAPFYGRDFKVNSHVLIPRPETEILIDRLKKNGGVSTLLDVGTGSGCIAITCSLENLSDKIYATDISDNILDVAHKNMQTYEINNIHFFKHNFLKENFKNKFDVVISNPPYIGIHEIEGLQKEVRDYDPKIALTDGHDGLIFYYHFNKIIMNLLNPGGYLLLEIGGNKHKEYVEKIFSMGCLRTMFIKDLQGDFRAVEVSI